MKKTPIKPLIHNEPLRRPKSKIASSLPHAPKRAVKIARPPLLDQTRVYRPEAPAPVNPQNEERGQRKLIRTTMEDVRRRQAEGKLNLSEKAMAGSASPRPMENTNAEAQYLLGLVQSKTPVVVKLISGETLEGWIEYMDKNFIRLTRRDQPNLFVYKDQIKYVLEMKPPQEAG